MYKQFLHYLFVIPMMLSLYVYGQANSDTIKGLDRKEKALNFIVIGDWGQHGVPAQQRVADVMSKAATQINASFVITTGDNFYPAGVVSVTDSQWYYTYERVYHHPSLQVKWYPVLGNHDYFLEPDAQVAYTAKSKRWYMPARYYDTSYAIEKDSLLLVFLDTEPIEREYRGLPYEGTKYPEGGVARQLQWLEQVLASSKAKWKIVTGHVPLHTGGERRHNNRIRKMRNILKPIFNKYKVDIYFAGHDHHLEYFKPKNEFTQYIISATGSDTRHVGYLKRYRKFAARKRGFVTVSLTSNELVFRFVSDKGKVLYTGTIGK